jgi:hypothetical protein
MNRWILAFYASESLLKICFTNSTLHFSSLSMLICKAKKERRNKTEEHAALIHYFNRE